MKINQLYKFIRVVSLVLFVGILFASHPAYAGHDNGKGNGGVNNGHGNDKGDDGDDGDDNGDGGGGAVPVNGGIAILALAGVAYAAKKVYELKPVAAN